MSNVLLFPFAEYWWFYGFFTLFVLGMLLLDLGVFHRKAHAVTIRESAIWSLVWVGLALVFNWGLWEYSTWTFTHNERLLAIPGFDAVAAARGVAVEFLTGFVVEKALAVDNLFVFVIVFSYFSVPEIHQHRVLFFGILGALIFRAIFIALGAVLLQYHWVVVGFGVLLILTGMKILLAPEKAPDLGKNPVIRMARRFLPLTDRHDGERFWTRESGRLVFTPLFLALLFIEASDIIFAVDSVPAIFALTDEPLIVFTSNIFAILGMRSLYFMLAGVVGMFRYLKYGLGFILMFVGVKMAWLNTFWGGKFPVSWSLGIIVGILVLSVAASAIIKPRSATKS